MNNEQVKNPTHYTQVPGIECWDVIQYFPANIAMAMKYLWRCGKKGDPVTDLRKAIQWIQHEIEKIEKGVEVKCPDLTAPSDHTRAILGKGMH